MYGKPEHAGRFRIRAAAWLLLALVVPLTAGCAAWTRVSNRAAADGQQFMEALAPLADPRGGATTTRGRDIEKGITQSQQYLP